MMKNKLELLAPAGDLECLQTALRYGADAVYVGGPMLQLRANHVGFTMETLADAVKEVHALGRKLYVTVNAFAYNDEIERLPEYAASLRDIGVDAVIVSDLGAIATIHNTVPDLPIHVSTQANCMNFASAEVYRSLGAERIVLAREMSLEEIRTLHNRVDTELEAFVHGAMCMSYSGRCMISAYLTGRSANRGACAQSCRWTYALQEEKRPGEFFPVEEDERGTTILSSHDLCCIDFLDQIAEAGVTSFKIEGRMKTPYYVATVVNAYRKRLDDIAAGNTDPARLRLLKRELDAASHRPYSMGFYFGELKHHMPDTGAYIQHCTFVGVVKEILPEGRIRIEVRNRIKEGDRVEILSPDTLGKSFIAKDIIDNNGVAQSAAARPSEMYTMACDAPVAPGDILRIRMKEC
ncbi:MAG: U32 family peptidase [Clostridia bacterium]|nr:U32 family peptidase [Clostridia bacterium]